MRQHRAPALLGGAARPQLRTLSTNARAISEFSTSGGAPVRRAVAGPLAALALLGNSQLRIGYSVIQSYSKAAAAVLRDPRSQRVPRIKDLHALVCRWRTGGAALRVRHNGAKQVHPAKSHV